jgi:hypothetical protein
VVLAAAMPLWAATLIMSFLLGATAAVLYFRATGKMRGFRVAPRKTVDSLKEDLQWAKHRIG